MKIIGINFLSESSVCLLQDGQIKYAISQERLNRKKNWYGLPLQAIKHVLKKTNNKLKDINYFTTFGLSAISRDVPDEFIYKKKELEIKNSNLNFLKKKNQLKYLRQRYIHEKKVIWFRTMNHLKRLKKKYKKLEVFDHHEAHAASALYYSGWKNCYVLTIDGWGDNSSSKLYKAIDGKLKLVTSSSTIDSLGYFYGSITKLLGFKPHQHEGKILGLAAFGNSKRAHKYISKMISFDQNNNCFIANFEKGLYLPRFDNPNLKFLKKKYNREDISAAAQKTLEQVVLQFVNNIKDKKFNLALAGGVFANVKLNQLILKSKKINNIFIFPNMGDGGLSVGTAALCYYRKKKYTPKKLNHVYLGPSFTSQEIIKEIKKFKLRYRIFKNPEKVVAQNLSRGRVIACFQGRMEFGPRALGNRSILCQASDPTINKWLNKRLKRTEFMPFAPLTLKEHSHKYYKNISKNLNAAKFMTITYDCTKLMLKQSPAAVHIDKTARPQIMDKKTNPILYKILKEYYAITGIPNIINTSFNMHEEPIVCNPKDAIRAFLDSKIDLLFIGKFIVSNDENSI